MSTEANQSEATADTPAADAAIAPTIRATYVLVVRVLNATPDLVPDGEYPVEHLYEQTDDDLSDRDPEHWAKDLLTELGTTRYLESAQLKAIKRDTDKQLTTIHLLRAWHFDTCATAWPRVFTKVSLGHTIGLVLGTALSLMLYRAGRRAERRERVTTSDADDGAPSGGA